MLAAAREPGRSPANYGTAEAVPFLKTEYSRTPFIAQDVIPG
jgi:hypothetical protein